MSPKKLQPKSRYDSLDLDNDGVVSDDEIEKADRILEMEVAEEKADSQRRMAWACLAIGYHTYSFACLSVCGRN
jgi:hypothetical protein